MNIGIIQIIYFSFAIICFLTHLVKNKLLNMVAVLSGVIGILLHISWLVQRSLFSKRFAITTTYETLILLSLIIMIINFWLIKRYKEWLIAGAVGITSALFLATSSLLSSEITPLLPALKSNWLLFHVLSAFLSYSAFTISFVFSLIYLVIDLCCKKKEKKMLSFCDSFTYLMIRMGFPLLTLGIATGAVWASICWGRYWNWDPKEIWSFVTWLVYAACLHMKHTRKYNRRFMAILSVIGFAVVIFTYFGVNYWLSTLHSYS